MREKPYRIVGSVLKETCVLKLKYNSRYVIVKCKNSIIGLKTIENALNAFIRGGKNNPSGLYYYLYNYVRDHPGGKFKVEYLLDSPNAYELLKKEQEELEAGRNDPNMLNNQTQAYIPQFDPETNSYGWIPMNAYLNFHKWLRSRRTKKNAE